MDMLNISMKLTVLFLNLFKDMIESSIVSFPSAHVRVHAHAHEQFHSIAGKTGKENFTHLPKKIIYFCLR